MKAACGRIFLRCATQLWLAVVGLGMTKTEQLTAVAARLSEEQIDALLSFARSMADEPFYEKAPTEALASLERGLEQIARGDTVSLDELSKRLEAAAKPRDA
jgi:hypothetical protein